MLVIACLLATACNPFGTERSVEAYCETLESETIKFQEKYEQRFAEAEADPLLGLFVIAASTAESIGDLAVISEKVARLAPEEVQVEHEIVAESMRRQADDIVKYASDPLGGLMAGLIGGAVDNGSFAVVDEFSTEHCGISLYGWG